MTKPRVFPCRLVTPSQAGNRHNTSETGGFAPERIGPQAHIAAETPRAVAHVGHRQAGRIDPNRLAGSFDDRDFFALYPHPLDDVARWIYVVEAEGLNRFKIGLAVNLEKRVSELQTGSPVELILRCQIPGGRPLESQLHNSFHADRVRGEWFAGSPRLNDLILYAGFALSAWNLAAGRAARRGIIARRECDAA